MHIRHFGRHTMEKPVVFIGWDNREKVAYEVLKHSIEKQTYSHPEIIPLYHKELRKQGYFKRPWAINALDGNFTDMVDQKPFSTEFSHTRFLVPALMRYKGWALFMDCDMIFKSDVKELFALCDDRYAVMCVKHRQNVKEREKMDGSPQSSYYRKNWSSFVLWNCGHELNRQITPEVVNTATGGWLHAFSWLEDRHIGTLPYEYNWIENCSPVVEKPKVIHYTLGGPWFSSYKDVMFSEEWWDMYKSFHHDLPDPSDKLITVDYSKVGK